MVRAITLLLSFSLPSLAGDNLITIQTQGTGTTITASQAGSSNTTGIYCGLGSFDNSLVSNHTCDGATITVDVTGDSNVTYSQSVWSNHDDQTWITTVTGNSNYSVIDMDESGSTSRITQDGNDHQSWILGSGVDNSGSGHRNDTGLIQKGSGNKDADVFWYGADDGELTLTQQGNGSHTSNIKFYTDDYDVTVVQKGTTNKSYSATFNCSSNCTKTISIMQEN